MQSEHRAPENLGRQEQLKPDDDEDEGTQLPLLRQGHSKAAALLPALDSSRERLEDDSEDDESIAVAVVWLLGSWAELLLLPLELSTGAICPLLLPLLLPCSLVVCTGTEQLLPVQPGSQLQLHSSGTLLSTQLPLPHTGPREAQSCTGTEQLLRLSEPELLVVKTEPLTLGQAEQPVLPACVE
jgi:hypothetical protein